MFLEVRVNGMDPEEVHVGMKRLIDDVCYPEGSSTHVTTMFCHSTRGEITVSDEVDDLDYVIQLLKQIVEGIPVRRQTV